MFYDNDKIMAAIWADPTRATGLNFERRGGAWVSQQDPDGTDHHKRGGRTILRRNDATGVIYINCNGEGFTPSQGIISYLKWRWNTNDAYDVYRRLGEVYGIEPDLRGASTEQVKRYERRKERQPIYDAMALYLTAAIKTDKGKIARQYIQERGLRITPRLGAINEDILADLKAALRRKFADLSAAKINSYVEDLFTLGEASNYRVNTNDYQVIGPYYNGSNHVAGFWLRRTAQTKEADKAKYLYTQGLVKNGYCFNLKSNKPVILVEGMLDVERVYQAAEDIAERRDEDTAILDRIDLTNVMAMGGALPTDNPSDAARSQIATLARYGVKEVILVPDLEYYTAEDEARGRGKAGQQKTKNTTDAIKVILPHLSGKQDGEGFISLRIAQLANRDPAATTKQDADSYIKENGPYAFKGCLTEAIDYYHYQLKAAVNKYDGYELKAAAQAIYLGIVSPLDKEQLKAEVTRATTGYLATLKEYGFNSTAMAALDRNGAASSYWDYITADAANLNKAIESKATAEQIGEILKTAAKHQATKADGVTAISFEAQANATPQQIEKRIADQPGYIETSWGLYRATENDAKEITEAVEERKISFAPAAISIVAAPTNYGKTAFMMQTAIQLAARQDKRYIYLSTEEDQRQLYLRACCCYIGDKWPRDSHPRKDLREAIKEDDLPPTQTSPDGLAFDRRKEINRYNDNIAPYLKLIYSNEDVTTFAAKILAQVEEWRNEGIEVGGIFIDYLQMLRAGGRCYSRADEVQLICSELNALAKATGLPLIIGSQMNRQATQGGNYGVGLDGVGLENLSDGSGIEKIAQDAYLLWNTNKEIQKGGNDALVDSNGTAKERAKLGYRTRRIVTSDNVIKPNAYYVENLKARDYETGAYCLLSVFGAAGSIAPLSQYK